MTNETNHPNNNSTSTRPRRGSLTSNTFAAIFGRSNIASNPASNQPTPANPNQAQPRRLSITTLGLSGTSPIQPSPFGVQGARRTSVSTAGSDSLDESAIDDEDGPGRSIPTTPFGRRVSFGAQALFNARGPNGSPGSSGEGLNWSEQFRSRAESALQRPSFSTSPSGNMSRTVSGPSHERAKSVSDMPEPPSAPMPARPQPSPPTQSALRRKPDAVGERILRGEFYMD